jgi:hypothetical protein
MNGELKLTICVQHDTGSEKQSVIYEVTLELNSAVCHWKQRTPGDKL